MVVGDAVAVRGIRARGFHGVLPEERRDGQEFVVDVTMGFDVRPAAASDDLALTVDYSVVAADVVAILEGEPVDLIETLAERIAASVLTQPLVQQVEVAVHKPEAPVGVPFGDVVVTITRSRRAALEAVIGVGSNLGDRLANLQQAVDAFETRVDIDVLGVSPVYETEPVGGPEQGPFLNAVVRVATPLDPLDLLAIAHEIEDSCGRVREERWGPRTLDVDLLTVAHVIADTATLTLPHPRAHERAFVLAPWFDLDPDAVIPAVGAVRDLLARVSRDGVVRRDDLDLRLGGPTRPVEDPAAP